MRTNNSEYEEREDFCYIVKRARREDFSYIIKRAKSVAVHFNSLHCNMDILEFAHYMLIRREHEFIQTGVFNSNKPTEKDIERWKRVEEVKEELPEHSSDDIKE